MIQNWPNAVAHVDADYFYVNAELSRRPELRGKPVMVLGKLNSCVLAKSPEAKTRGIGTAMPVWEAKKACPDGIFLFGDFRFYTLVSRQMMDLLSLWSPTFEISSCDEAFMDLNGLRGMYRMGYEQMAEKIRQDVKNNIGVTVSLGVSVNKTLSKMACEVNKPDGVTMVPGREIESFLKTQSVEDIPGVGHSRKALLDKYGIKTAYQFSRMPTAMVQRLFGKTGLLLWRELRGDVSFPIVTDPPPPKRIGRTSSFNQLTSDVRIVQGMAMYHLERAMESLYRHKLLSGEASLYLREKGFRSFSLPFRFENPTADFFDFAGALGQLFCQIPRGYIWRSAGVFLTRLSPTTGRQLDLFEDPARRDAIERLNAAKLKLNERFGRTTVRSGSTLYIPGMIESKHNRSGLPFLNSNKTSQGYNGTLQI